MNGVNNTTKEFFKIFPSLQSIVVFMQTFLKQTEAMDMPWRNNAVFMDQCLNLEPFNIKPEGMRPKEILQRNWVAEKTERQIVNGGTATVSGFNCKETSMRVSTPPQVEMEVLETILLEAKKQRNIFNMAIESENYIKNSASMEDNMAKAAQEAMFIYKNIMCPKPEQINSMVVQVPAVENRLRVEDMSSKWMGIRNMAERFPKHGGDFNPGAIRWAFMSGKKEDMVLNQTRVENEIGGANFLQICTPSTNYNVDTGGFAEFSQEEFDVSTEELRNVRGAAQKESTGQYTTAHIAVDFQNNATINSDMDIDEVMHKFTEKLREAVDTCAEGVHYCV